MGGLLVLVLVGLYLWIAYVAVRKVPKVWGKALALVVVVLIPTADAVYGRLKLKHLCETEGGMRIFHTIGNARGFYQNREPREEWVTKGGFDFTEGKMLKNGNLVNVRIVKSESGLPIKLVDVPLISIYELATHSLPDIQSNYEQLKYAPWVRTDIVVQARESGEALGRVTDFNYAGGWVERLIASIYAARGNAGTCNLSVNAWEYSQLDAKLVSAVLGGITKGYEK